MKKLAMALLTSVFLLAACGEKKPETVEITVAELNGLKNSNQTLSKENTRLASEVKTLKDRPIVEGLTTAQCSAMAENIVAKSCTAKVPSPPRRVAKIPPKQPVAKAPQAPATATGCPGTCPPPVTQAPSAPVPSAGAFWGWIHPEANVANKRTCFADRQITGMPPQCSSVQTFPRAGNETEQQWNARVAAHNGIAVGVKNEKGTITGTEFRRVEVR